MHYMQQRDITNARIARWVMFLQDYKVEVKYYPGLKNVIADSMSREGVCNVMVNNVVCSDFYSRLKDS